MTSDFSFTFRVTAALLDAVARPGVWRVIVEIKEPGELMVEVDLGTVANLSPAEIENMTQSLKGLLRSAVKTTMDGLVFRIRNPVMGDIIAKFQQGLPRTFCAEPLGEPFEGVSPQGPSASLERFPCNFKARDRVASFDRFTAEPSMGTVMTRATAGGSRDSQVTVQYDTGLTRDEYDLELVPLLCSACGQPQIMTPSGVCCPNGHGGADPKPPTPW